jgi:hypothetical protein
MKFKFTSSRSRRSGTSFRHGRIDQDPNTEKTPLGSGVEADSFGMKGRMAGATLRAEAQTRATGAFAKHKRERG